MPNFASAWMAALTFVVPYVLSTRATSVSSGMFNVLSSLESLVFDVLVFDVLVVNVTTTGRLPMRWRFLVFLGFEMKVIQCDNISLASRFK